MWETAFLIIIICYFFTPVNKQYHAEGANKQDGDIENIDIISISLYVG